MTITLERAIALAAEAHEGKFDKGGAPYILHPIRVMLEQNTTEARIVAVFHDVIEDCEGWSFERVAAEGFTADMIQALRSVSKIEGEQYEDFVVRAAANPIGRAVKVADLRDNLDISRIAQLTENDLTRINKYKRALHLLSNYGEDGLTDSQRALRQSLDRLRNLPPGFKMDMRDVIEENRKAELEHGKNQDGLAEGLSDA